MQKEGIRKFLASLISILLGLVVGAAIVVIVGVLKDNIGTKDIFKGVQMIFHGILATGQDAQGNLQWGFNAQNLGNMLFRATPIIMTGLSVAVAFKTGLFNIGAPGQFLMGTMSTLMIALSIPTDIVPAWIVWILAFLGGMLAGALWGAIPGLLKAFLNINEVLACIMTNWIAAYLVSWSFDGSQFRNLTEGTKTAYIYKTSFNGVETPKMLLDKIFPESQVNGGIIVAVVIAVLVLILLNKTTLGYELKACGSNRHAARYAGINDKRNIVLSMAIAGALAAGGASLYWLSGNTEFYWNTYQTLPSEGFDGISVALLATNNPIGVIFTGIFMSMLKVIGNQLPGYTAYNEYITEVIIGFIVYLSAFSLVIRNLLGGSNKPMKRCYVSLPLHIILCALTGGVWPLIWVYRTSKYLNNANAFPAQDPLEKTLLYWLLPGYAWYWGYKQGKRIVWLAEQKGVRLSNVPLLSLLLFIFFPVAAVIYMQVCLNLVTDRKPQKQKSVQKNVKAASVAEAPAEESVTDPISDETPKGGDEA